ncbi:hypothetical protein BDV93DRAFT_514137 [Ceratobasidium sp. AG-I]|nr:hypothetical protein BDV93DRAFT_514137 [Ceratobasidium sp. AG-I]
MENSKRHVGTWSRCFSLLTNTKQGASGYPQSLHTSSNRSGSSTYSSSAPQNMLSRRLVFLQWTVHIVCIIGIDSFGETALCHMVSIAALWTAATPPAYPILTQHISLAALCGLLLEFFPLLVR